MIFLSITQIAFALHRKLSKKTMYSVTKSFCNGIHCFYGVRGGWVVTFAYFPASSVTFSCCHAKIPSACVLRAAEGRAGGRLDEASPGRAGDVPRQDGSAPGVQPRVACACRQVDWITVKKGKFPGNILLFRLLVVLL
jgi:hypothetical protein